MGYFVTNKLLSGKGQIAILSGSGMVRWEYKTIRLIEAREGGYSILTIPKFGKLTGLQDHVQDIQFPDGRPLVKNLDEWLNDFGLEGWEAYSVKMSKFRGVIRHPAVVSLKRQLKD